jgi:phospholipase D1/2
VLKPGFLALLEDPFDSKLLDIILFDVLPSSDGNGEGRVVLAKETKERNPLHTGFQVTLSIYVCVCVHVCVHCQ